MKKKYLHGFRIGDSGEEIALLNEYLDNYFYHNPLNHDESTNNTLLPPGNRAKIGDDMVLELVTDNKPTKSIFDESTEKQLKQFQKENKLLETGILDKYTSYLMTSPRCFNRNAQNLFPELVHNNTIADMEGLEGNASLAENINDFVTLDNLHWRYTFFPKTDLTYMIQYGTPDVPSGSLEYIMSHITQKVTDYTDFSFQQVDSDADIIITFNDKFIYHDMETDTIYERSFGRNNPVLGYTLPVLKGDNRPPRSIVTINLNPYVKYNGTWNQAIWTDNYELSTSTNPSHFRYFDVYAVLIHEFSHAIGLGHPPTSGAAYNILKYDYGYNLEQTIMWWVHDDRARTYTRYERDAFEEVKSHVFNLMQNS